MTKEEQWVKESIENYIFAYTGKCAKISDADAQHFTASVMSYLNLCTPSIPSNLNRAAEEFALEAYPLEVFKGSMCDRFRSLIALGYKQAEKDLALTKEDVEALIEIWMNLPDFPARSLSQIAEETLEIFKEHREKK